MKKLFTLLLIVIGWQFGIAQVTITQNDMPQSGDELYRTRANVNPFLNYGATGPNHVWNFTNLTASNQDSAIYQSVSSTNFVYAIAYVDIFLNPNRANHARQGVDIPFNNLLPIDDPYTFYYRNSSVYKKVGYGVGLAGIPVPIIYSNHDEIYSLPINYNDNDSTFSSYNISIPTLAYYGYEQSRINEVDGWGVVNTPAGTFNALRVKTELYGRDSINLDTLSLGFTIDRPLITEYKWLSPGYRVPVLQINTTELFGVEIITDIFFYDEPRTLNVAPPLANVICPGSIIPVSYVATGVYNSGGIFNPANIFRAQLSDATGDFSAAVNIGQVTATTSGTINATIPANTPAGTGYRIRVISTNPAYTGNDNGFDLSIGTNPVANATAMGVTTFCDGGSVLLSATSDPSYTYQWQLDGVDVSGANASDYIATVNGNYTAIVTNACGSVTTAAISVTVNDLPEHTFAQSSYLICDGTPVTLAPLNVTGQSSLTYQWLESGIAITGETNATLTTTLSGSYSVEVINSVTGCAYTSSSVSVTIDVIPAIALTATGNTTFCDGSSVNLEATIVSGLTYQWYLDGTAISGATNSDLTATTSGNYTVEVTTSNGCTATSNGIAVIAEPLPSVVTLNASGALTFCQGGSVTLDFVADPGVTYGWYQNGILLSAASGNSYTVIDAGQYSVVATNAAGCTSSSLATTIVVNALPANPVITPLGSTVFCAGGSVILETSLVTGYTYQWTVNGLLISGATSNQYTVADSSGFYSVEVTNADGCSAIASISYQVVVNPLPAVPVITAVVDTLFASGSGPFQWYLNGNTIAGATGSYYVVTANGNYSVMVTDSNGCESASLPYIFTTVGIGQISAGNFNVFPNPSNGVYVVQFAEKVTGNSYMIHEVTGKLIMSGEFNGSNAKLDIGNVPAGIYFLTIANATSSEVIKLVKN
ncbi:MAG: T9SS type A sorting domain-containing protein [Bacteroidetes bacterium]|nr:T9SS type A sorting domain-containing protein [Bacteroidota bacterium]